jgi:uncharacterized membrane protein
MTRSLALGVGTDGGLLDLVNGIPVHPLVVHAAVVLVPLAALGLIAMAASRRFSRSFGWVVATISLAAAAACLAAKESGEALEDRVGEPGFDHADLGDIMPAIALGLVLVSGPLWLLDRRAGADAPRKPLRMAVAGLAVIVAAANLVWVYRVGDSGAKSVWTPRVATSAGSAGGGAAGSAGGGAAGSAGGGAAGSASTAGTTGGSAQPATGAAATYTLAEVSRHNSAGDCWAAIDSVVYDLGAWVDQHPGGAQRILDLCGTDGTSAFRGQHGSAEGPESVLEGFAIGQLG